MPTPVDLLRRAPVRQPLWGTDDAVRLVMVDVIAAVVLGAAYVMAERQVAVADQLVWINVGAAGVVVSGVAHCRWLLSARSAVGRRRARLLVEDQPWADADPLGPDLGVPGVAALLATATGTVFHRAGCSMIDGRSTTARPAKAHLRAGRRPCPVCEP